MIKKILISFFFLSFSLSYLNAQCSCNVDGTGVSDGTFTDMVSIIGGSPGHNWAVTVLDPLNPGGTPPTGATVGTLFTDNGDGTYDLSFTTTTDGYTLSAESPVFPGLVLSTSNACALPELSFDPIINASYLETDPTVTLGLSITNGGTAAAPPTFTLDGLNNITQIDFDEVATDLTIGQVGVGNYNLTARYETATTSSGKSGSIASPVFPTNACPVEITVPFDVTGPPPVPTLSQWGLIILSLLMMSFVVVFSMAPKMVTTNGQTVPTKVTLQNFAFDKNTFFKTWVGVALVTVLGFVTTMNVFGYELTSADPIGAFVASGIAAYILTKMKK